MPEGDTIHRTAAALRRALVGQPLVRVELPRRPRPHPAVGATVDRVEARGKHLLIATSDGLIVHTHQKMTGSWHLYRPEERWRKKAAAARVVLGTASVTAVCFAAPVAEVLDEDALARHPIIRALGPDLTDPATDPTDAAERLGRLSALDRPIGVALLDQRIGSGVGNVVRSEVLFLVGVAPATPVGELDPPRRHEVMAVAARLLRDNLEVDRRTTVPRAPAGTLWVYGREGEPCRRCGTAISRETLGTPARSVYRCRTCQP
jgi:endonuclease VIII